MKQEIGKKGKELDEAIRKQTKKDKKEWSADIVDEGLTSRHRWAGILEQKKVFQPQVYARKDMHGNPIPRKQRAEATEIGRAHV